MTNYQKLVAKHLQSLVAQGHTQKTVARQLGLENSNVVSMHLSGTTSPMPLKRLPALARAACLSPIECVRLIYGRSKDHPDNPTQLDSATLRWMTTAFRDAIKARCTEKLAKGKRS